MDLKVLKDYFTFLTKVQLNLQNSRKNLQLQRHNSFSFYRLIATKSQSEIDKQLLITFIKSFTYNFQVKQVHQLVDNPNFELVPPDDNSSQDDLINKGVVLFLDRWSANGKLTFEQFAQFLKEDEDYPQKNKQLDYSLKKKFYQMLEDEIQNLLDAQIFRRTVIMEYRNLVDLFEMVSHQGRVTIEEIHNLYLMSGQRKNELFFQFLAKRFPLPCDYDQFRKWFTLSSSQNKYKKQTKVYYSSLKRKKNQSHFDNEEDDKFTTPNGKSARVDAFSSTRMTKADRLHSAQRSKVEVSRFTFQGPGSSVRKNTSILADILTEQQRINEIKRQLIFRQDYDLELIYQRKGKQFQQILNSRYGSCNFTSFVRYLVPQDFEHRYLAFIKYQKQCILSEQTEDSINNLITQQHEKQERIKGWWQQADKEMIFRGYCNPGDRGIKNQFMKKYFTERECKILLDRFDPNKTGIISLDNFY